jgi:hypothetical protein
MLWDIAADFLHFAYNQSSTDSVTYGFFGFSMALSAASKSAMISLMCSIPVET